MSEKKIGIKIANGTFYPILEEDAPAKKRLVLTTVRNDQDTVQIDLYRGEGEALSGAQYIGSLVIDTIQAAAKGEPEISFVLGLDDEGNVSATAVDDASGDRQSLTVGLHTLTQEDLSVPDFELDDFEIEDLGDIDDLIDEGADESEVPSLDVGLDRDDSIEDEEPDSDAEDLSFDDFDFGDFEDQEPTESDGVGPAEAQTTSAVSQRTDSDDRSDAADDDFSFLDREDGETWVPEESESETAAHGEEDLPPRRGNNLLMVGFIILALAALAVLIYFIYQLLSGEPAPPLEARLRVASCGLFLVPQRALRRASAFLHRRRRRR